MATDQGYLELQRSLKAEDTEVPVLEGCRGKGGGEEAWGRKYVFYL